MFYITVIFKLPSSMTKFLKRNCILCGSDNSQKLFNFTFNFITKVRNQDPESIKKFGWDRETNNWIVKCNHCGCAYVDEIIKGNVLDVDYNTEIYKDSFEKEFKNFFSNNNSQKQKNTHQYNESILRNILHNLKKKDEIKLLDFGSGHAEFSLFKDSFSIKEIVSYDPRYPNNANEIFYKYGINSKPVNNLKDILNYKFDIIICQSVIEHVTDPGFEISCMKKMLNEDGIIYINNPYMNIEKDLKLLLSAKEITKKDHISCYHISHVNYMMPNIFINLCKKNNLKLINFWQKYSTASKSNNIFQVLKTNFNSFLHFILNTFGIFYKKQHFFLKLDKTVK